MESEVPVCQGLIHKEGIKEPLCGELLNLHVWRKKKAKKREREREKSCFSYKKCMWFAPNSASYRVPGTLFQASQYPKPATRYNFCTIFHTEQECLQKGWKYSTVQKKTYRSQEYGASLRSAPYLPSLQTLLMDACSPVQSMTPA